MRLQQLQFLQVHGLQWQAAPLAQPQFCSAFWSLRSVMFISFFQVAQSERITI